MEIACMPKKSTRKPDPTVEEARRRVREKAKELREKNIVPPVDEDEPLGPLSGGPEHLDLEDDASEDSEDR